jgi:SAM-dependent methyltransferase
VEKLETARKPRELRLDRQNHFKEISSKYRALRTFDREPLVEICKALPLHGGKLKGFDLGCGTGRYTITLLKMLQRRNIGMTFLLIDECNSMLDVARQHSNSTRAHLKYLNSGESALFELFGFDIGMTTNAIHHFDILLFLNGAVNALRTKGLLYIYTRTQEQNRRTIWGKYFPGFADRETRLLCEGQLGSLTADIEKLELIKTINFEYKRKSSLGRLLEQMQGKHYSTFNLYSDEEFKDAADRFEYAVRKLSKNPDEIEYAAENVLYIMEKQ